MLFNNLIYIFILLLATFGNLAALQVNGTNRFPDDFLFGVSTAAYQIEGGWNVDGKGPSIWDEFTHSQPHKIKDRQNGDVGPNSYEYYLDDIAAVKHLNMDFYRFSISWSRVLPTGDASNVNEKGIEYYNKVIDKLLELNIKPMVTMYHFDLPQKLQTIGGLTNSIFVNYFEAYANLLFERFGDRVKYWITFNEPELFCMRGYGDQSDAPGTNFKGVAEYLCGHNVLMAHARAYHSYKSKFAERFKGQIGISLHSYFYYSYVNDTVAVDRAMQFSFGWLAHPIFSKHGNYPAVMIDRIAKNSKEEGCSWSRLPILSEEWIDEIRGSADFLGLNYYSSRVVGVPRSPVGQNPSYERDRNIKELIKPEWKPSINEWLFSVPEGLGDFLRWIKNEYNNPMVFVTENGWSDGGELEDDERIQYTHDHLHHLLDVVLNEQCNVKGYAAWSIIDNFQWVYGYTEKFGFYSVNMTSPRRERTPKKSAYYMRAVTTTRQIPKI